MVERIRTLLEARQLTPTQFADAIGVARPIVSHILSGRNKPSLEVVQRILGAMPELSMAWLLNGTGAMQAASAPTLAGALPAPALEEPQPAPPGPVTTPSPPPRAPRSVPAPRRGAETASTPPVPAAPKRFAPSPPLVSDQQPAPAPPPNEPVEPAAPPAEPAHDYAAPPLPAAAPPVSPDRPIRRIVIFYRDGSFADYQPEQVMNGASPAPPTRGAET